MESIEFVSVDHIVCPFCNKKLCKILTTKDPNQDSIKAKFIFKCFNCGNEFKPPKVYYGRTNILQYNMNVNVICDETHIDKNTQTIISKIITERQ